MLELTCENVLDYLRGRGWLASGPASAEILSGGVSNQVLRIIGPHGPYVVKQPRPQLRTRDAWFSDLDRIWREQEVMQVLAPLLPVGTVPGILFVDRQNYVYGMTHAPVDAQVWKTMLLAAEQLGGTSASLAGRIGSVLGMMHEKTARRPDLMEPFRDHTVYVQLRVDPFYRRIQERRPEVAHIVAGIIDEMLSRKEALCHGDYTPKNILVDAAGFTLVDYETAHFGDPTMDLGLFLAHLLLKACRAPRQRPAFFELTRSFWHGYEEQISFRAPAELRTRGIRHLGVCLLARVDGTSPVDYLSEPQREAVRRFGRRILLDNLQSWDDVLACAEAEMSKF
jgi:5-methylthioribose kinase